MGVSIRSLSEIRFLPLSRRPRTATIQQVNQAGEWITKWRQARSREWLEALEKGLNREFPGAVRGHGLKLMCYNGSQPTSLSFMKTCSNLEVQQAFTSYKNPKGNTDTERMIRTLKEKFFWLREWESETELSLELDKWVYYYNRNYLHSAHGYRTPIQAEEEYYRNHASHLNAAWIGGGTLPLSYLIHSVFKL